MIDGLRIVRLLKKTERFESFEVEYEGRKAFAKHAVSDNTAVHLVFQEKNSRTVNEIGGGFLRSPEVLAKTDEWIVTEWIEGSSIEDLVQDQPEKAAEITAKAIHVFDSQPDSATPLRPIFTHDGLSIRVEQRIDKKARAEAADLFAASLEIFKKYAPSLRACLQDADIQPEHLLMDPKNPGALILIDSEHLNTHWPRFYDLANNYSKYWKRDNREFAAEILRQYLKISDKDSEEIFRPLSASLIVRALALHWEQDYDPGAEVTNIPRSQELLRHILQADSIYNLL